MKQPNDAAQRAAALDTARSHHVESPAGSGKTALLTRRFLKLLAEVRNPAEILAITFTEKAAGEMRQRITGFLSGTTHANDPDGALALLAERAIQAQREKAHLLASSDTLNIMTFHGFCSYIARRAPLEARVAPDCEIIDNEAQAILMEETVQAALKGFFSYPATDDRRRAFENRLLYHNSNWNGISSEFRDIIQNRGRFRDLIEIIRGTGDRGLSALPAVLNDRLRVYIEGRLRNLISCFKETEMGQCWKDLTENLNEQEASLGALLPASLPGCAWDNLPSWQTIANALTTKAGTARKSFGPASGFYGGFSKTRWGTMISGMGDACAAALAECKILPSPGDIEGDVQILSDFIVTAADLIDRYETACRDRHVVDFAGLEQAALHALGGSDPSDIQLYLDHRIRHLLVDEFQDTNRAQWEIVSRLCAGWSPEDGRTVFIVGDPKQSIYSFRNAEVSLFMEAKKGIPVPGGGTIPLDAHLLTTNFRSGRKLIDWINGIFGTVVMKNPDPDADEVPFSPSEPYGGREAGTVSLALFADDDREKAKDDEAAWLAGRVREVMKRAGTDATIGVLLFTRNRIGRYLRAFKEQGIPVQVREGIGLTQRPEVMHLMKIAELLANPHDDLAWASLLRSPWLWLDANLLYETARQEPESWMEKIMLMARSRPEMEPVIQAMETASRRVGRDSLGTTVRAFWEDLDGPRRTASRYGMAGVANCMRFLDILEGAHRGTPLETLRQVKAAIHTLYEPADPAASRSSVEMMTIHRAKGLEFDVVFLPFTDWAPLSDIPAESPPYLLERVPGTEGEYLVAMGKDRRSADTPPVFNLLKTFQKKRRWGEAKRLFYVAATRAKEALYLSGVAKVKDDGTLAAGKQNILQWIMEHEGIDGADIEREPAGQNIPIEINPVSPAPPPEERVSAFTLPEPYDIRPERQAYTPAKSPSTFAEETLRAEGKLEGDEATFNRARGTVIHAILSAAIGGRKLPTVMAVARFLESKGIARDRATRASAGILEEAEKTLADPFVARLMAIPGAKHEWELEDSPAEGRVRSGVIDLAVLEGDTWWICDFKTSRPENGQSVEDFITQERNLYRPQIEAYREMLAHLTGVPAPRIRAGIYLAAILRWEEL
ncbi:MAG: UvrD-helicase domain-containing protein [Deltaproteobacteria bacterium]|nr:UvrD-helicase domain-containing protein [Deltaproteobacteria bacterium]